MTRRSRLFVSYLEVFIIQLNLNECYTNGNVSLILSLLT